MTNGYIEDCSRLLLKRAVAALYLAWSAIGGPAHGAEGDAFKLDIAQDLAHDSNLFRAPDGTHPVIDGRVRPRGDVVSITTLSGVFDRTYSRQRVVADVGVSRNDYREFNHLDFTALNGRAAWQWVLGNQWSGDLSADQTQFPRSFADRGTTVRSINTYRHYAFDGRYLLHPEWSLGAGLGRVDSRFDDRASATAEYVENAVEGLAMYRSMAGSTLALVARTAHGNYPGRTRTDATVTDYDQREVQVRANWPVSGHSRIGGYAGYTWREYPGLEEKNFSGVTGRVTYDWTPTGKLALGATARREIGAREDVADNFVVTRAVSIDPVWNATTKFRVRGRLEWLDRDYGGSPFAVAVPDRDDKTRSRSIGVEWSPSLDLILRAEVRNEHRSASATARGYSADVARVSVKYVF